MVNRPLLAGQCIMCKGIGEWRSLPEGLRRFKSKNKVCACDSCIDDYIAYLEDLVHKIDSLAGNWEG